MIAPDSAKPKLHPANQFTATQIAKLMLWGAVLWFLAAMTVRTLGPAGALDGGWSILIYAFVIIGTIPVILITRQLANLRGDQTAVGIALVTATALLLDGAAHAWFPVIYGSDPALIIKGAALIFWAAGVAVFLGFFMDRAD